MKNIKIVTVSSSIYFNIKRFTVINKWLFFYLLRNMNNNVIKNISLNFYIFIKINVLLLYF